MKRLPCPRAGWRLLLALALGLVGALAPAPAAQAGFLGRHTILGKVFRLTPLGRAVNTFEQRRDAYRAADAWLVEARSQNATRGADLKRALASGALDLRAYVHAKTTLTRHEQQYAEVAQRMKALGHDNFNRALGQQALEHLLPRIANSALFQRTVGDLQTTLDTGRKLLEQGVLDIQALANRAYPEFMRQGRAEVQQVLKKLDESGLSGGPLDDIKARLRQLDGALGDLERKTAELVKPEAVKQLQDEAAAAAKTLQETQSSLSQAVARLQDKHTVYLPPRSAQKDPLIASKLAAFHADPSLVQQAIAESQVRRALGPRLEEALTRVGVERSDPLYSKIRQRALNLLAPANADDLSDGALEGVCETAARQIRAEAEQPRLNGIASLSAGLASLTPKYPPSIGSLSWRGFQYELPSSDPQLLLGCQNHFPRPVIRDLSVDLVFNLDTGEMSGSWSGSATGQDPAAVGIGDARGAFEGGLYGGQVTVDGDGKGFQFEGQGWTTLYVSGAFDCGEAKQGTRTDTVPATVSGTWRAGSGELGIGGHDSTNMFSLALVIADPPFVISQ